MKNYFMLGLLVSSIGCIQLQAGGEPTDEPRANSLLQKTATKNAEKQSYFSIFGTPSKPVVVAQPSAAQIKDFLAAQNIIYVPGQNNPEITKLPETKKSPQPAQDSQETGGLTSGEKRKKSAAPQGPLPVIKITEPKD